MYPKQDYSQYFDVHPAHLPILVQFYFVNLDLHRDL